MQFDNPMPTFDPEMNPDSADLADSDLSSEDREIRLQEQLRLQVESNLNLRSVLHGTFYTVLLFVLFLMFLEVEFDILYHNQINGLIALCVVLGGASTIVKSRMDDMVYDPNYEPSSYWRFIIFVFFIVGEIFLFLLVRELVTILTIEGLAALAGLVGAVNLAVLWQFVEEEFDDYREPHSDTRTVLSNYAMMVFLSVLLFIVQDNLPTIKPITNATSLFLFLFYSGFFWTYALFDRETVNVLSRTVLSFLISIVLLPLSIVLLGRIGLEANVIVIVIMNFALCTMGFLAYNARPRFRRWLYAG